VNVDGLKLIKVTAIVKRSLSKALVQHLSSSGLTEWYMAPARTIGLQEKRRGLGLIHFFKLIEELADIVIFFTDPSQENQALELVIKNGELTFPGRGSVFTEEVTLISPHEYRYGSEIDYALDHITRKPSSLVGLCCIVQRGEGNKVARVALDMGSGVPAISFGSGTGIRDKLGLLRVAIPSQKEIIHLALNPHDSETVMRMMIQAGELDLPGKGFLFLYPIRKGVVDTRITQGFRRHVASVEQMIATLDELKGDVGWRRRSDRQVLMVDSRFYLKNLADVILICNEGTGKFFAKEAMKAGTSGATISRLKHYCPQDLKPKGMSSAREACNMCIPEGQLERVTRILEEAGVFEEAASGELLIRGSPSAYTYS